MTLLATFVIALSSLSVADSEYELGKVSVIKTKKLNYALRVPKKFSRKKGAPAIIFIHGSNMNGEIYCNNLSSRKPYSDHVIIGPTGPNAANERQYNHGPGDEKYIESIIEDVEKRLKVKLTRIYVGGHSQGGFLSHAVAAHLPDRIDGVFALAGGTWVSPRKLMKKGKGRKGPVPIAIVHAQDDPVVGFGQSVYVYDAYVKAGHPAVRLYAPTRGAHMFNALPFMQAVEWLDLMNEDDKSAVGRVLSKTKRDKDPRTAWDAAHRLKLITKNKSKKANGVIKKMKADGKKKAKALDKKLKKAKKGADKELVEESYLFLADWGMVAAEGDWRKSLKKALKK